MDERLDLGGKYLAFSLAGEEYGLGILKVREIVGMMPITPVVGTSRFIKGVINLREHVIPVVDLRLKFGIQPVDYNERTCIVVVEIQLPHAARCWNVLHCDKGECPAYGHSDARCWMISGTHCRDELQGSYREKIQSCSQCEVHQLAFRERSIATLGIVVDTVSEVMMIKDAEVAAPPAFGMQLDTNYILGMARTANGVKILLDIDAVFTDKEKHLCISDVQMANG